MAEYRAGLARRRVAGLVRPARPSAAGSAGDAALAQMAAAFKRGNYRKASSLAKARLKANPQDRAVSQYLVNANIALARQIEASGNLRQALKHQAGPDQQDQ